MSEGGVMSRSSEGIKCAEEAAEQEGCVTGRDERIFEQERSGNGYSLETSELMRLPRLVVFCRFVEMFVEM